MSLCLLSPLAGLVLGAFAQGPPVPASDGWVTDLGDLLTPSQEASLESLMESYESGTTHEIALLTVPSLEGASLERFALEVGRSWGIGGREENNGALLLVARDDRLMRIEVGRGLEGALTDSIAGRIIRDVIAPQFKRERYYEGIRAGIEAMHAAIGGDYGPIHRSEGGKEAAGALTGCVALLVNLGLFYLFFRVIGGGRSGRRGRGGSDFPWWILWAASAGGSGGRSGGGGFGGGGGFSGFGGGGGFSGGGASGGW